MSASGQVCKLARFGLTAANGAELAAFYESAFGFDRITIEHLGGAAFERLMRSRGSADRITLRLGEEKLELLQFEQPGQPYPAGSSASDLLFQHFAIVVADMASAWQRLRSVGGWSAITRDVPQRLPETSGGVTAFKFRDPEGHPLELLAFPSGNTPPKWHAAARHPTALGIDHSAISVANTAVSCAFYSDLGFRISACSFNCGPEQEILDDLSDAQVDVTALVPADFGPHVELLCYRSKSRDRALIYNSNDIAATRLFIELSGPDDERNDSAPRGILDPDAHHLIIVPDLGPRRPYDT